jgi:hypothetical protein
MILFSSLIWSPASQSDRALVIHKHLDCVELALKEHPGLLDVLFVFNGSEEGDDPSIVARLDKFNLENENVSMIYNLPQVGWAKGRNQAILQFQKMPKYNRLVMSDCDQWFKDTSWITKIKDLADRAPSLKAYMIQPHKEHCHGHSKFVPSTGSSVILDMYEEWWGTTNVINREVAEVLGGYDCVSFPQNWGFHDVHYGLRLKKSGLLRSTLDWYVDPIRIEGEHLDCPNYQDYLADMKSEALQYNRIYMLEKSLIQRGEKPLYFDPKTGLEC